MCAVEGRAYVTAYHQEKNSYNAETALVDASGLGFTCLIFRCRESLLHAFPRVLRCIFTPIFSTHPRIIMWRCVLFGTWFVIPFFPYTSGRPSELQLWSHPASCRQRRLPPALGLVYTLLFDACAMCVLCFCFWALPGKKATGIRDHFVNYCKIFHTRFGSSVLWFLVCDDLILGAVCSANLTAVLCRIILSHCGT